jgi:carbonic anhydrase/acetyltransferase-like protein (isoleucine patch superfamily)
LKENKESCCKKMIGTSPYNDTSPKIHPSAFIAKDAVVIGDVTIGEGVNIWFGSKIRGDWGTIIIDKNTSIQENTVIHSTVGGICKIGKYCTIAHGAVIHGPCDVGDSTLIGMNATVLQNAKVGSGCVLAGNSVIRGEAKENSLYAGVPAILKKAYPDKRTGEWGSKLYVDEGQKFKKAGYGHDIPEEFLMK